MNSFVEFRREKMDGKLIRLVYHNPSYNQMRKTQSSISLTEAANPLEPYFLCPRARMLKDWHYGHRDELGFPFNSSPEYVLSTTIIPLNHRVLPLFWCNNKEFDVSGGCWACCGSNFGTDYYFCEYHDQMYHKECVESPPKFKHPYHPQHPLQLYYSDSINTCVCCRGGATSMVYHCTICQVFMHTVCAMRPIPFVIDQPKRHDHPLTFFTRHTSLLCNVCGLVRQFIPTYVCLRCNFVAHSDCMYSLRIIKISRHRHHITYISSLQSGEWSCGVCRQSINGDYGAYTCNKCTDYGVHSSCAFGENVWDEKELEGVPEEDDLTKDDGPFDMISEGVIIHFLHDHHLRLETTILYDDEKICQMCVLPISEGNIYSCGECEFILHETCAAAPRRIQHALHPHPLTLKVNCGYGEGCFGCNACRRNCGGFVYQCPIRECYFDLDVKCASVSEPFDYKSHRHSLFLALDPVQRPICNVCKTKCYKQLNCIKCNFIVCFKCATLPSKARYKHEKHFLEVLYGEEVCEKHWCEVCERGLKDTCTKVFYWSKESCITFHIECLFGEDPYMKPGQVFKINGKDVQVLHKSKLSRSLCYSCKNPCQGKIFNSDYFIACSVKCITMSIW